MDGCTVETYWKVKKVCRGIYSVYSTKSTGKCRKFSGTTSHKYKSGFAKQRKFSL